MAGSGKLHRLFRTFLKLQKTCKAAKVRFHSDSDGDILVTLSVKTPGHGDQAPRRGGRHYRSQGGGSGIRPPTPAPSRVSYTMKPCNLPAPVRRSRRRPPSALLRNEQRRLLRIDSGVFEVQGGPALPPTAVMPPLAPRERVGEVQVAKPVRNCTKCRLPVRGHLGPTGLRRCTASPAPPYQELLRSPPGDQSLSLDSTARDSDRQDASSLPVSPLMFIPDLFPSDSSSPYQSPTLSLPCQPPPTFSPTMASVSPTLSPPLPFQTPSTTPLLSQRPPPTTPLTPQPLAPGQYVCMECSVTCEDTDIQPLGCSIEDCYGQLKMHPALVRVWPVCCSRCWSVLWNKYMGYSSQGEE